jgi:hypothetical protein
LTLVTVVPGQIPVDRWLDLIGEPTLADATLDRIIHNAHRLQLSGVQRELRHAGRLRTEQVADINRNAPPTSSEYAFAAIRGRVVWVGIGVERYARLLVQGAGRPSLDIGWGRLVAAEKGRARSSV